MNSDATSVPTHSVRAKTALHVGAREESMPPSAATCTLMMASTSGLLRMSGAAIAMLFERVPQTGSGLQRPRVELTWRLHRRAIRC